MRLKKLELHGFKSFADRTAIYFDQGITVIVGPNGCGKSNVLDAFRWVLGEQSAKSLRGGKMGDVIFAGTSTRNPLNYAEVSLTLTDVGGDLPVEYDEVVVTRRLHRSGESEYLINRHPVRMRDVQSLFLDSGMGKNAFSIFEQGKIDQVINLGTQERRYIFEEAAGILRFLQRKREALRKLEQTDSNMARVGDIHREVQQRIQVLEEQAAAAKAFKQNQAELDRVEKGLFLAKSERLHQVILEGREEERVQTGQLEEQGTLLTRLEREQEQFKGILGETEAAFQQRSEALYQARSHREIQMKARQNRQERLKEAALKEKKIQDELKQLKTRREEQRLELERNRKREQGVDRELLTLDETLQAARKRVKKQEQDQAELRQKQQAAQRRRVEAVQLESRSVTALEQNRVRLEHACQRQAELVERKKGGSEKLQTLRDTSEERKGAVDQMAAQVDRERERLHRADQKLADLEEELKRRMAERETLSQEMADTRARHEALRRIKEEMEGFSTGTKYLVREAQDPASPLFGKVALVSEEVRPEPGYELAVSTAMRAYAQTLRVLTEEDFQKVITFAREQEISDFSLVCLEHAPKGAAVSGSLMDHVAEGPLARYFLGQVALTEDADEVLTPGPGELEVVTREGGRRDHRAVFFFSSKGENNVFLREAELRALEGRLQEVEEAQKELERQGEQLAHRKIQLQAERKEADQQIRKSEMKLVETNFALQTVLSELKERAAEQERLEEEWLATSKSAEEMERAIAEQERLHGEAVAAHQGLEGQLQQLEQQLEESAQLLEGEKEAFHEVEEAHKRAFEEHHKLLQALKVFTVKEEECLERQERLEREWEDLQDLQRRFEKEEEEGGTVLGEADQGLKEAEEERSRLEEAVKAGKKRLQEAEVRIQEAREEVKKKEKAKYQLGIKLTQAESQLEALVEELRKRFHLEVVDLQAMGCVLEMELEEAEKRIRALRRDLEKAGDVNMTSIEEFGKQKERYELLSLQMDDMATSKEELMSIVEELDGQSRKLFSETFEIIRSNFQKNFKILFNGGEADLKFTDSRDVLEAGIDIIAKPPGKQMKSIQLLSGGEKCLTAISLLFAIFEVKSAPFCILDEIDAPLDDTNIERFVNVVKQFIDRSQFIIITHNKRTMAIADKIFGISMQERGVSKVLSMSFSPEAVHAEELVCADHGQ